MSLDLFRRTKLWIDLDRHFGIFESLRESQELGVGASAIVVSQRTGRVAFDGFGVRLDSRRKITGLSR